MKVCYAGNITLVLKYDRGTLAMWEVPEAVSDLFTWDARSSCTAR